MGLKHWEVKAFGETLQQVVILEMGGLGGDPVGSLVVQVCISLPSGSCLVNE